MHFFFTKAVLLFCATLAVADDRCSKGPFVKDPPKAGVLPPNPACHTRWDNGEVIVGVEAWAAKFQVKAIRFKYSQQGWGPILGTVDKWADRHEVGEWKSGEEVKIQTWDNKPDDGKKIDAVGRILITTNQGQRTLLDIGGDSKKTQGKENYGANMGGGMILGARVGSGAWLDYIEFNMLRSKVKSAELTEVNMEKSLEEVNKKQEGIEAITLTTMYFVNGNPINGSNMIYEQELEEFRDTESTITTETTNEWTAGVTVTVGTSIGVPLVSTVNVEAKTSVGYKNTQFESETLTEKKKKRFQWSFKCDPETPLRPQRAAKCVAKSTSGDFEGSYIGTVEVKLVDGSTYKYKEKGEVKTMSFLDASHSCIEIDIKDVPKDIKPGKTVEVKDKKEKRDIQRLRVFRA